MCLLCVIEPNTTPTREQLIIASQNNPDGFGYAFHCGDRIITGRGMDAEEVIDRFLRIREGLPNTWAMFHARITTHGQTSKSNCHPFRMNGDPSTVVGHNGIIPIKLDKDDHRSDTRVFADEWLPELITLLDDEKGFEELEQLVGASKVAIFTHDPRLASQVYILNEHMGHWKDGVWWSNSTYCDLPYSSYFSKGVSYGRDKWWDDEYPSIEGSSSTSSETRCEFCHIRLYESDFRAGKCYSCGVCLDCFSYGAECICYTPAYAQRQFQYEADAFGNVNRLPLDYGTMDIPF